MGSHQQTKMGEGSKQVRVDNWGIFFLQRLQMFFNKTDYCDLTLQFEGNVQLKVHRLVMNACTEYFRILEQTCEIVDDVLIMPSDLQADVVLPIVNFMYTGMLEFHMSIFDKLYKTANLMNITVLTKLLDAQKTPIAPLTKSLNKKNAQIPHTWNLQGKKISAKTVDPDLPATLPGRKLPVWKRKSVPTAIPHTILPHFYPEPKRNSNIDPLANFDNAPKPTRFEWPDDEISSLNVFDSSFDDISYTSKPLLTKEDEPKPSTSFDRIKETPDSSKKSNCYENSFVDIEDVKDYVKEQRIRTNMNEEDEDDVDNDFDSSKNQSALKRKSSLDQGGSKRVRFNVNEKENQKTPKINILPTGKISSDVNHTKIISEVLKKYPNLVKKNKNIRLKILAKTDNVPTPVALESAASRKKFGPAADTQCFKIQKPKKCDGTWKCDKCSRPGKPVDFVLYYLYRKHMTDVHNEKLDSRICKFCGHKSSKHSMLMYHQFVKHGVKPPPVYTFPKCSICSYVAPSETYLLKHQLNHYRTALQCVECDVVFSSERLLADHMLLTGHSGNTGTNNFDCQYCSKKFQSALLLFTHLKNHHRDEVRKDGIASFEEEDADEDDQDGSTNSQEFNDNDEYISQEIKQDRKDKIKILSDVKLSSMEVSHSASSESLDQHNLSLEPSSEAEALNNVASGIATSLGLVDVVVLDENQQYILHTDNRQTIATDESEFILPDLQDSRTFTTAQQVITSEQNVMTQSMLHNSDIASTDELVMVLTDHDYGDGNNEIINSENANIVVLYSHPIEGQESQFLTSQGNIMLTSQAGLIELRNTNAVVTSTGSHLIGNCNDSTENAPIESIEMIQREIDRHPDVHEIKPTTEEHVDVNEQAPSSETIEDTPRPEEEEAFVEENVESETNEETKQASPEDEPPVEVNVPQQDEDTERTENEQDNTNESESAIVSSNVDTEKETDKEETTEANDVPSSIETDMIDDATPAGPEPSDNNTAEVLEEDVEDNVEDVEDNVEDVEDTNVHLKAAPETESEEKNDRETEDNSPTNEVNSSESANEEISESKEENDVPVTCVTEEDTRDSKNEDKSGESVAELSNNVDSVNYDVLEEDETSQEVEDVPREDEQRAEVVLPEEKSDKSARIILEDWEDTDSQQSDPKPNTNVHKLIDDWDDDEDDRKS